MTEAELNERIESYQKRVIQMFEGVVITKTLIATDYKKILCGGFVRADVVDKQIKVYNAVNKLTAHQFYQKERAKAGLTLLRNPGDFTVRDIMRKLCIVTKPNLVSIIERAVPGCGAEAERLIKMIDHKKVIK